MLEPSGGRILAKLTKMPFDYLLSMLRKVASGEIKSDVQFEAWVKTMRGMLWLLRRVSAYIYGKTGRRRAALFVLFRYMGNLAILGFLTIFFWALAIKLYKSPVSIGLSEALLASAAHVIPGVPDPDGIRVGAGIQAGTSLMAWAIFVLYAGPVASMFPMLQEKYIKEMADHSEQLWGARLVLYRISNALGQLFRKKEAHAQTINLPSPDAPSDPPNQGTGNDVAPGSPPQGPVGAI
jgi:hypothetical protein